MNKPVLGRHGDFDWTPAPCLPYQEDNMLIDSLIFAALCMIGGAVFTLISWLVLIFLCES
jgi:hypothetical protein